MTDKSNSDKSGSEIVYGPAFGEQTEPNILTDGEPGDLPAPVNTIAPNGDPIVLTPSSHSGPTNRYYTDKLVWAAKYHNKTTIAQYDKDGIPISTESLPREGLRVFMLIDQYHRAAFVQELRPGQQFIYRRRTALKTGEDVIEVIHIVGWQQKIGDETIRHIAFIYESDMHIEMGDFRKDMREGYGRVEQWRYPIKEIEADEKVIS